MMSVCLVLVLYNPDDKLVERINSYIAQVEGVVLIDNTELLYKSHIHELSFSLPNIQLINNIANIGIAAALNQGIQYALRKGYDYALLMDQDSVMMPGSVKKLKEAIENDKKIFIACTKSETGNLPDKHCMRGTLVEKLTCISSGSLMNLNLVNDVGLHDEKLFIDLVDHEICLRAREKGYKIVQVNDAIIIHNLGNMEIKKCWFMTFFPTHHYPLRRYYKARNSLYIWTRYFFKYPLYVLPSVIRFSRMLIEILLFEADKIENLKMVFKGFYDSLRGHFGKYREPWRILKS